jgi:hypothetical protein
MTDENANTADLTINEKLDRILERLAALEARGDDRARETRPLLDQIIKEMVTTRETLEQEIRIIRREIGLLREDMRNERMARAELGERIDDLERRPN